MYCLGGEFKYSKALWEEYKDEAEAANSRGPVLAHCRDAFRGSRCSVLYQLGGWHTTESRTITATQNSGKPFCGCFTFLKLVPLAVRLGKTLHEWLLVL